MATVAESAAPSVTGPIDRDVLRGRPLSDVRAAVRSGYYGGDTAGLAAGRLQVNLAILPAALADDFHDFCARNPRPCPLLARSETGAPSLPGLGAAIDVRTDAPRYVVYENGEKVDELAHLESIWRDDLVTFAIGCSYTFEHALARAGIAMRHIESDRTVPMYRTSVESVPAGDFGGGVVMSMRPVAKADVDLARDVSSRFPWAHGAPMHVGDPAAIGIDDIDSPDWGDAVEVRPGETPVFWGCGVTQQNALLRARPSLCITHKPGHMLITDHAEDEPLPHIPTR